jgi:transcriptional regulator with XRE-family HTH domain
MQLAKQLRAWRGTLTQKQVATKLGVGLRTYQDWEQGRHSPRGLALNVITEKISLKRGKGREASRSKSNQRKKGKPPASGPGKKRVTNAKSKSR